MRILKANKWIILTSLFTLPAAILGGIDFYESSHIILSGDVSSVLDSRNATNFYYTDRLAKIYNPIYKNNNLMRFTILEKYKEEIFQQPVQWLESCIGDSHIHILSNETFFEFTEPTNTSIAKVQPTWRIQFKSPDCLGIEPSIVWTATAAQMIISRDNAIGNKSWFHHFERDLSYYAGIPTRANNYTVFEYPTSQTSVSGDVLSYVGAGLFGIGTYIVATFGTIDAADYFLKTYKKGKLITSLSLLEPIIKTAPIGIATWSSIKTLDNTAFMWYLVVASMAGPMIAMWPQFKRSYHKSIYDILSIFSCVPYLNRTALVKLSERQYEKENFANKIKRISRVIQYMDSDNLYELAKEMGKAE